MKNALIATLALAMAACTSAEERDRAHYTYDNAIYHQCKELKYVPGTQPFRDCKARISERLDHEPYKRNEHSTPKR